LHQSIADNYSTSKAYQREVFVGWDKRSNKTFTFENDLTAQSVAPKKLVKIATTEQTANNTTFNNQNSSAVTTDDLSKFTVGVRVQHQRFGNGTIKLIEGRYPQLKATVSFDGVGDKQLLLQYAKLKIIN